MDKQEKDNLTLFAVIGLVGAICCLLFAAIPCIGFYATFPAVICTIFSIIPFVKFKRANEKNGVALAGIIIGSIAFLVGIYQYVAFKGVFDTKAQFEEVIHEMEEEVMDEVERQVLEEAERQIEEELYPDSTQVDTLAH